MSTQKNFLYLAITLSLITIASRATNNMVVTTLPDLGKYVFNFNNLISGVLDSIIYIATFVSTSYLNPKLNSTVRRKAFIIANGVIVLVLLGYYLSNIDVLWLITVISGISFGLILPNLITSASLTNDKKAAERLLGLYSTSLSISLIVGPSLESYILYLTGKDYRDVFLFFIPIALLGFALSWTLQFPNLKKEERGISVLKSKGFISSILSITTYNVPFAAFTAFLTIYGIEKFHLSPAVAYSAYIPFFTLSFLTRFAMTLRPFNSLKIPLLISILITIFGVIGMTYAPTVIIFLISMALLGIPHGSIFPMSTIMIARATTQAERNAVNSYFLAYNNILFTVIPAIVGYLSEIVGLSLSILVLEIPVVISAVLFFGKFWSDKIINSRD
ncbi:MFS transporter [Acidianus sulfidivorans JP7]|uniref:MFS transporter n=1 Tax=Acidianus sulfidivorans JP7 TaxID=619593 RepID=A0A2U9IQK9_9CREN|nr:MFS transporter [Acidianus sulfidivorans]AWR98247.1 MFS transporter [Acidianus sulfidivorans JP7]